ncbi:MAG: shikimate kinase [Lutibacter sp.]|uniref:shikimate kinase n=1 Tax=Lutibacter sp. TaxID=1925666 RepID=UPI0017F16892|nr:shikimate kinase [Lutibacter sp.]MBT8316234.1 shikimate kinase [Lutibacter sp.]NNJ57094.1 shikimate kinase [Lutibacter sp.]
MKIVLLGYMASGKSTIGVILGKKLNIQFIDLDTFIEEKEQLSISEIFKQKGEIYFRKKEGEYLSELLDSENDLIISLGGGTPCYGNNMNKIQELSTSFYLNASINTIFERLKDEKTQRPLVTNIGEHNLKEYIAKHLFERNEFYKKATNSIDINDKSAFQIIEEIVDLL